VEQVFFSLYENILNQPVMATFLVIAAHIYNNTKWEHHDKIDASRTHTCDKHRYLMEKVEKYIIKFEEGQSDEKEKRVKEIINTAKNSTTIIVTQYSAYFQHKENREKCHDTIYNELLSITTEYMSGTWSRLTEQGYQYEVTLMQQNSKILMPMFSNDIRNMVNVYKEEGLNGKRLEILKVMLVAFETQVVNSWERLFRALAYS
jgi:hypothetical protein